MKKIFAVIVMIALLNACSPPKKDVAEVMGKVEVSTQPSDTIKFIERVFMHTPEKYSFLARNNNDDTLYVNTFYGKPRFISDVPDSVPMWAKVDRNDEYHNGMLYIHIRSVNDIQGGGWTTGGKHSRDEMTSVVQ